MSARGGCGVLSVGVVLVVVGVAAAGFAARAGVFVRGGARGPGLRGGGGGLSCLWFLL